MIAPRPWTDADYAAYLEADLRAFIAAVDGFYPPGAANLDPRAQRAAYSAMRQSFHQGRPAGVSVRDETISGPGGPLALRHYAPPRPPAARVLFIHGGGFVVGDLDSHDDVCADICAAAGVGVTAVDYRLAPEHVFPADFEDVSAAFDTVADAFSGPILLVGDSAGAALCAGLSHARKHAPRRPAGQVLIYPTLMRGEQTGSALRHASAPLLSWDECLTYGRARIGGDAALLSDSRCAPLTASEFKNLPPTAVFAAECDPLADDGRVYAAFITAAGGKASYKEEAGLIHSYLMARGCVKRAQTAFENIVRSIADMAAGV